MRDFAAAMLMLASFAVFVAAVIALFRPLPRVWMGTRKRALAGFGVSFGLFIATAAVMPAPDKSATRKPDHLVKSAKSGTIASADSQIASFEAYPMTGHSNVKVDLVGAWTDGDVLTRASLVLKDIGEAVKAGAPDLPKNTKTMSVWFTMPMVDSEERHRVLEMKFATEDLALLNYGTLPFQSMLDQYEDVDLGGPVGRRAAEEYCGEDENSRYSPRFCAYVATPL
jgi:hypothetical protein